jgi:hypothetical protein
MSKSKNDVAWEKIFEEYQVISTINKSNHLFISSNDINKFREARLMTKFDHRAQLPKLFFENNLSILPVSRGGYIIGLFETFHDFTQDEIEITKVNFPPFLESLDYENITSETIAINCAFISGIIQDFVNEENLHSTVNGRMSSSSFNFSINLNQCLFNININNAQVEIDAGYEGENSLNLIEAKNYISDDFLVRQLFYPYKLWAQKIKKKVRPIFLTYTNGIFHLREYIFFDSEHYNSIELVKQRKYVVRDRIINTEMIQQVINNVLTIDEAEIPFPQADSFERVINLCELLKYKGTLTKEAITQNYGFSIRQAGYYSDAARYLELIESIQKNNITTYYLTEKGQKIFNLPIFDRQIEFAKLILSHEVFKKTLIAYFTSGCIPKNQQIVEIMHNCNLWNIQANSTYSRRAVTILCWINWIINLIEE